jgi:hypothetical protein
MDDNPEAERVQAYVWYLGIGLLGLAVCNVANLAVEPMPSWAHPLARKLGAPVVFSRLLYLQIPSLATALFFGIAIGVISPSRLGVMPLAASASVYGLGELIPMLFIAVPLRTLPVWLPITSMVSGGLVSGVAAGTMLAWRRRRLRWRLAGRCDCCGYNLTGNVSGVCPECGVAVKGDRTRRGGTTPPAS